MSEDNVTSGAERPWWWRVLGLRRREGKRIRIGLTWWGVCVVLMGFGGIGMAAFAEYSMQPEFCNSCHIMEPYFKAWHQSTHKNVNCTMCHFEPGLEGTLYGKFQASSQAVKYITQTYGSKPHAEIHDSSCLREGCHAKRLLEGKVNWTIPTANGNKVTIKFDHTPHLKEERRGKQLRCVSCHSQIVQGQHLVVTLDTCFLCHFKGLKHGRDDQTIGTCKGCHDAPKGQIRLSTGVFDHKEYLDRGVLCENCHSDSVKGDGAVPRQVCWTCHNQTTQVSRYNETQFVHEAHVSKHKVECSSCHVQIEHSLTAGASMIGRKAGSEHVTIENGACGQCHEQTHGGPAEIYRGVGGRGVPEMPSPMYRAQVDCIACHKAKEQSGADAQVVGQTFLAVQASCNYCHGEKYEGVLGNWKKMMAAQVDKAEALFLETKGAMAKAELSSMDQLKVQRLLDDADHNIRLVKLGHGVHNVNYATAVLNVAMDRCREAKLLMGPQHAAAGGQ